MHLRRIKIGLSIALLVISTGLLVAHFYQPLPKVDPRPHVGMGQAVADRVLKLASTGGRITLIAPDTANHKFPGPAVQLQAFHEAMENAKQRVTSTNRVKMDPNRVLRVPSGDFAEALRRLSDTDVVVSLLGPPILTAEQRARVGEKRPKVVALCIGNVPRQVDLRALFAENLLHAAVISRVNPPAKLPESDDPAEWFNHLYLWVTAQNVSDLPEFVGK